MARWLLGVVLLVSCARDPISVDRSAIVGGAEAAADEAVVALVVRRSGCEETAIVHCSGTVIAPRVVLTAAHCAEDLLRGAQLEVYAGANASVAGGQFRLVSDWIMAPGWNGSDDDLALMRIDSAFDGITPVDVNRTPLDAALVGRTVRIVGFGLSDAGQPRSDGKKREGTMSVTELAATTFSAMPSPAVSCQGDSGGPVFDAGALIGLTAGGDSGCSTTAVNTRVDAYLTLIDDYVAAVTGSADDSPVGTIALEQICSAECGGDQDCPGGFHCTEGGDGFRCTSLGSIPGAFGDSCTTDDQCGDDTCARVWSHGADACRCAAPCSGGGCQATSTFTSAWLCLLALGLALVRRRAR